MAIKLYELVWSALVAIKLYVIDINLFGEESWQSKLSLDRKIQI